jgi:hypothetical protein
MRDSLGSQLDHAMTIPTSLAMTELTRRLHATDILRGSAMPDQLRDSGVEAVYLEVRPDGRFRVILEGLRSSVRPSMEIEGRGQLIGGPSGSTSIEVEVHPKTSAVWKVAVTVTVFLGLTWYNLVVVEPPNKLAYILPVFAGLLVVMSWLQVQSLTRRVWPGVLIAVRHLLVDRANE